VEGPAAGLWTRFFFVFDNERTVTNPYLLPPAVLRCTSCGYNLPATWSEAGVGMMSLMTMNSIKMSEIVAHDVAMIVMRRWMDGTVVRSG
jgi:hypothetical protein